MAAARRAHELEAVLRDGDPDVLAPLGTLLLELDPRTVAQGVAACLREGAEHGRSELWRRIAALAPVLGRAADAILAELDRTDRWWAPADQAVAVTIQTPARLTIDPSGRCRPA